MKPFSKDDVVATQEPLDFSIIIPETIVKGGSAIELTLKPERSEDTDKRKEGLLGKPESERQKHNAVTAIICSMLAKEPNVVGFPQDKRDLDERAYEYFTANNPSYLQQAFDKGLENILIQYMEVAEPVAFFRGFASDHAGSDPTKPGDQPVDQPQL